MENEQKPYIVTITETLKMDVEVEAASREDAEQIANDNWRNSEYILDAGNFVDVEFEARPAQHEPEKAEEAGDKITVLLVEPMTPPQALELDNTLKAMQRAVGGRIEVIHPFDDGVLLVCNEEGKLMGLQPSRGFYDSEGRLKDILVGSFFLCGEDGENFASLTPAQLEKYTALFAQPEDFVIQNGKIVPVPMQAAAQKEEQAPPPFKRANPKKHKPPKKRGGDAR